MKLKAGTIRHRSRECDKVTAVQRVGIQWLLISKTARYTLCRYENLRVDEEEEGKKKLIQG